MFQIAFGNSCQNTRHSSAWGREESLELYSILWPDWPTSKQKVHITEIVLLLWLQTFVLEGEKRRLEIHLRFAGYLSSDDLMEFGQIEKDLHYWTSMQIIRYETTVRRFYSLTLSLPERMLEFLKVVLTFDSVETSCDVTIKMKRLCLYFQMVLFVSKIWQNKIWKIFLNFVLGHTWPRKG